MDVNTVESRTLRNPLDRPIEYVARRFGGAKSKEVERFLRFSVVGVTGAIVDFGVLLILQATFFPPADSVGNPLPLNAAIATATAFFSAVLNNFIWTRIWVYPDSRTRSIRRQLAQFTVISVIGGTVRTIWVTLAFFPLGHLVMPFVLPVIQMVRPAYIPSPQAEAKIGQVLAQLIGMAVVMLWNFFANRYWTYNDVS